MVIVIVTVIISLDYKTIEYKLFFSKGSQRTIQTDRRTDRHIIFPLKGFEPVACVRMRCIQLRAAHLDRQKAMRKNRQRDIWIDIQIDIQIISTGPQCRDEVYVFILTMSSEGPQWDTVELMCLSVCISVCIYVWSSVLILAIKVRSP